MPRLRLISLFSLFLAGSLILTGCFHRTEQTNPDIDDIVTETGFILDISDSTGQAVVTQPGDIIRIALPINLDTPELQWGFRSPLSGGFISLKSHTVNEEFSDWSFRIEKKGQFDLRFIFSTLLPEAESVDIYEVNVLVADDRSNPPGLFVTNPVEGEWLTTTFTVNGFALSGSPVVYKVTDSNGLELNSGFFTAQDSDTRFVSFNEELIYEGSGDTNGVLEIVIQGDDASKVEIPIRLVS
ncbi:hypothetical protein CL634_00970 [bacterium]|nr:hypothetical protein [bacterium]|tara:strand:- start:458 stop:1180 length:723 start_codon:yes stop_codon:yes gene_type:complete